MTPDRQVHLGDLSHLTPEEAELYAALYAERNRLDPAAVVDQPARTTPRRTRRRRAA